MARNRAEGGVAWRIYASRRGRFELRFPAVAMKPDAPFGLGALWAGAGAKYSWRGICACATVANNAKDREHEIYWWQGLDGSRILMKWNSLLVNNQHIGGYAEARDPFKIVDFLDSDSAFLRRYPYRVIGAFGKGWDDAKTLTDEFIKAAPAKTFEIGIPGTQKTVKAKFLDGIQPKAEGTPAAVADGAPASVGKSSVRGQQGCTQRRCHGRAHVRRRPDFMKRRATERDQADQGYGSTIGPPMARSSAATRAPRGRGAPRIKSEICVNAARMQPGL
jgi:hypothetical protein